MVYANIDTYRDLAEKAGVSENTIYKIVGEDNWTIRTLDKIAATLGCETLDLLTVETDDSELRHGRTNTQTVAPFVMVPAAL